jgi:hypothetical protein
MFGSRANRVQWSQTTPETEYSSDNWTSPLDQNDPTSRLPLVPAPRCPPRGLPLPAKRAALHQAKRPHRPLLSTKLVVHAERGRELGAGRSFGPYVRIWGGRERQPRNPLAGQPMRAPRWRCGLPSASCWPRRARKRQRADARPRWGAAGNSLTSLSPCQVTGRTHRLPRCRPFKLVELAAQHARPTTAKRAAAASAGQSSWRWFGGASLLPSADPAPTPAVI